MTTLEAAETFLYSTLSAHGGLGALVGTNIYPDSIPTRGTHPAVVFLLLSGRPTLTQDEREDMATLRYLVKGIAEAPKEAAGAISEQILLAIAAAQPALVGGAFTVNAIPVESFALPGVEPLGKGGARQFYQEGAIFRIRVRPV